MKGVKWKEQKFGKNRLIYLGMLEATVIWFQ